MVIESDSLSRRLGPGLNSISPDQIILTGETELLKVQNNLSILDINFTMKSIVKAYPHSIQLYVNHLLISNLTFNKMGEDASINVAVHAKIFPLS